LLASGAVVALAAAAVVLVPGLETLRRRLVAACGGWLGVAAVLEALSGLGFVAAFAAVFRLPARRRARFGLGACALASSVVLPVGGLSGPMLGGWLGRTHRAAPARLASRAVAFVVFTSAPEVVALGALGIALRVGLLDGPRSDALTLLPAALAVVAIAGVVVSTLRSPAAGTAHRRGPARAASALADGARQARSLVTRPSWGLIGAIAYYAADNGALWAAFRALGHSPPFAAVAMGYVVGGLGGSVALPAGVGGVEAGLTGALVLYGAPAAPAVAAVLVYRIVSVALPLALGAIGCTQLRHRGPRTRHPPA
jgi:uncharacterized membrane protein YbhN (UPF0104 family)